MRAEPLIEFVVEGVPATQGSKNPVVPTYKRGPQAGEPVRRHRPDCPLGGGRATGCGCPVMVSTRDDNAEKLHAWRDVVGYTARAAYRGDLLDGALLASFVFHRPRPKGHYGTGRNERVVKDSAPAYPTGTPDGLKLARAVEDALTGVIVTDDARFVSEHIGKRYVNWWEPYRVEVTICPAEHQTVADLVVAGKIEPPSVEEDFDQLLLV